MRPGGVTKSVTKSKKRDEVFVTADPPYPPLKGGDFDSPLASYLAIKLPPFKGQCKIMGENVLL